MILDSILTSLEAQHGQGNDPLPHPKMRLKLPEEGKVILNILKTMRWSLYLA